MQMYYIYISAGTLELMELHICGSLKMFHVLLKCENFLFVNPRFLFFFSLVTTCILLAKYIYILLYYVYVPWWNYFSRKFAGHTDTPIIYMIDKIMLSSQNVPIQQSIETSAWCVSKKIPSYIIPFANYQLYIPNGIIIPPTIHGKIIHPLCFMVNLLNTTHDSW